MFRFAASVHGHTAAPAAWPIVCHGFSCFPCLFCPWPRSDALASAPKPGQAHRRIPPNKKTYQQDPANFREVSRRRCLCLYSTLLLADCKVHGWRDALPKNCPIVVRELCPGLAEGRPGFCSAFSA